MNMCWSALCASRTRTEMPPVMESSSLSLCLSSPGQAYHSSLVCLFLKVIVDRFSKMVRFIPLPKLPSAKETAEALLNHVC